MEFVGFGFTIIFTLVFWGGIIALIVLLVRRSRREPSEESAGVGVRRFFQYLVLLISLILAATGVTLLIGTVIAPADTVIADESPLLATALAFVIVGVPVYLLLLRWTRRKLDSDPAERASVAWAVYVNIVLISSLMFMMGSAAATLAWVLRVDDYGAYRIAILIVSAALWFTHRGVAKQELSGARNQAQLAFGSAAGLIFTAGAVGATIGIVLAALYDEAFSTVLVNDWSRDVRNAVAFLIVGGLVWWWHWGRNYEKAERRPLWYGYVLILGILGGLIAVVSALGTALFAVLEYLFGDPEQTSTAAHFEVLIGALVLFIVGGALWWYHRSVLRTTDEAAERHEVDRVYQYLLAGLGLVTAAIGIIILLVAFFQSLGPSPIASRGSSEVDTVIGAITLLVIGLPIWWSTWSSIQRHATADPGAELDSPTRRIYLFLLFGLGALIAIVALVTMIATTFDDLLSGDLGAQTIDQNAVTLALLITIGLIAGYHWWVYRSDRAMLPDEEHVGPIRELIIVAPEGLDTAAIAGATGARVRVMRRTDEVAVEVDAVVAALEETESERVMVVTTASGEVHVIPLGGTL